MDGSSARGILKNRLEQSPRLPPVTSSAFFGANSEQDSESKLDAFLRTGAVAETKTPSGPGATDGYGISNRVPPRTSMAGGRASQHTGESGSAGAAAPRLAHTVGSKIGGIDRQHAGSGTESSGRVARSLLGSGSGLMGLGQSSNELGRGSGALYPVEGATGGSGRASRRASADSGSMNVVTPSSTSHLKRSSRKGWLVGGPLTTVEAGDPFGEDKQVEYSFYPGSGDCDCPAANVVNVPVPPLWRATKTKPKRPTASIPAKVGRLAARQAIEDRLIPALRAFGPDLILISAGFDGGSHDIGNSRPDGKATPGMDLKPEDFAHITSRILDVSRSCCPGRVVSVLEGGYGRWKFREPKAAATRVIRTRRGGSASSGSSGSGGEHEAEHAEASGGGARLRNDANDGGVSGQQKATDGEEAGNTADAG